MDRVVSAERHSGPGTNHEISRRYGVAFIAASRKNRRPLAGGRSRMAQELLAVGGFERLSVFHVWRARLSALAFIRFHGLRRLL